jgi:hypothetical protein
MSIDIKMIEAFIYERGITSVFKSKEIDDLLLTGVEGAVREAYRCCNEKVAIKMVALAEVKDEESVLEPGAGKGVILKLLKDFANHWYCEINNDFVKDYLYYISDKFVTSNFLVCTNRFNKIIINPPFSFNQYAAHILHAYELLLPGGILVALYPKNAELLPITNHEFLKLLATGETIDVGNVCGQDTSCKIFKVVKP